MEISPLPVPRLHRLRRGAQLVRLFWGASVAAESEYRLNFLLAFLTSVLNLGGSLFALFLFYHNGYQPGGWSWASALLVLGLYTIFDGFSQTLLAPNLNRIINQIQDGTLDFVLLKPTDSQFWLSLRVFSLWGIPSLFAGAIVLTYAVLKLHAGPGALARGMLFLPPAALILYSLWFMLSTLSIWFVRVFNITSLLRSLLEAGRFPVDAFPGRLRVLFTFIVPVAFLTTVPARAVTGPFQPGWLIASIALATGLFIASRLFWRFALGHYSSASS